MREAANSQQAPHTPSPSHVQGRVQLRVVQVEDVEHQHLQGVRGDEAVVRPQQPALVVAPRLELRARGGSRCKGAVLPQAGSTTDSIMLGGCLSYVNVPHCQGQTIMCFPPEELANGVERIKRLDPANSHQHTNGQL